MTRAKDEKSCGLCPQKFWRWKSIQTRTGSNAEKESSRGGIPARKIARQESRNMLSAALAVKANQQSSGQASAEHFHVNSISEGGGSALAIAAAPPAVGCRTTRVEPASRPPPPLVPPFLALHLLVLMTHVLVVMLAMMLLILNLLFLR